MGSETVNGRHANHVVALSWELETPTLKKCKSLREPRRLFAFEISLPSHDSFERSDNARC